MVSKTAPQSIIMEEQQHDLASHLERHLGPVVRALLMTSLLSYTVFVIIGELVGHSRIPLWLRILPAIALLIVTAIALTQRQARWFGILGLSTLILLEIGIFLNGYSRSEGSAWILPVYILVPIVSVPIWQRHRDFILAMLISCVIGPLPLLLLSSLNRWERFQYIGDLAIVVILSSVTYLYLNRMMREQFKLEQRLRQIAYVDELTGLATRRRFFKLAENILSHCATQQLALSVLYLDADHFKQINDEHGHAAGDEALRVIGKALRTKLRDTDLVGRIGGEEFAVLLPGLDTHSALETAERLRQAIGALHTSGSSLSISIGVTTRQPKETLVEPLLARADRALTKAKQLGRNRCELATY